MADLGGLGAREGSPIGFDWERPPVPPVLLPWLVVLGLLAGKSNRCAGAWLIWLPLGAVMVFTQNASVMMPNGAGFVLDVVTALAIGLAAVWLLAGRLRRRNRFLTFLCVLAALAGFGLLAAVMKLGAGLLSEGSDFSLEAMQVGVLLAVAGLATSVALSLGGLACRRGFRPLGLYLWLLLFMGAFWLLAAAPFFVVALLTSGGSLPWGDFFGPVLVVMAVNFATLLPFLILSSASPFFRERLQALLNLPPAVPPAAMPAPGAAATI